MYFGTTSRAIWQANLRNSLEFSPTPGAVDPSEALAFPDAAPGRYDFNVFDVAENLDAHALIMPRRAIGSLLAT